MRERLPTARRTWDEHAEHSEDDRPAALEFRSVVAMSAKPQPDRFVEQTTGFGMRPAWQDRRGIKPSPHSPVTWSSRRLPGGAMWRERPMTGVGDVAADIGEAFGSDKLLLALEVTLVRR